MGSISGSLDLSPNHQYKLELRFKDGRVLQEGTFKVEGETLTMKPLRSLVRGAMKKMPADVPEIKLNLTWINDKMIQGRASRSGMSKISSLDLWR
jgi:hypothetical protein